MAQDDTMTKKIKIQDSDFEAYFENALKSHGYLFPTTDEQMSVFEESIDYIPLPKELETPDFVFENKKQILKKKQKRRLRSLKRISKIRFGLRKI